MGTFSLWHWLIVLVVVVLVFGTKKLRNAGGDLGSAVKNFKDAMQQGDAEASRKPDAVANQSSETVKSAESKKENV